MIVASELPAEIYTTPERPSLIRSLSQRARFRGARAVTRIWRKTRQFTDLSSVVASITAWPATETSVDCPGSTQQVDRAGAPCLNKDQMRILAPRASLQHQLLGSRVAVETAPKGRGEIGGRNEKVIAPQDNEQLIRRGDEGLDDGAGLWGMAAPLYGEYRWLMAQFVQITHTMRPAILRKFSS